MSSGTIAAFRRAQLAMIHVAKKHLGLDDELYRAIIRRITRGRTETSAEMSAQERGALIEEFRHKGFAQSARPEKTIADGAQQKKIIAMWIELHRAGRIRDGSDRALNNFVRRVTRVSHLRWLRPSDGNKVIEALKAIRDREDGGGRR